MMVLLDFFLNFSEINQSRYFPTPHPYQAPVGTNDLKFIYKLSGEFSGRVWTTRLSAAVFFLKCLAA